MNLTYTVLEIVTAALSKIGVDATTTEPKNVEDAHRNLNLLIGTWSADEDMAIARFVPLSGYANLTDTVDFPPEYVNALVINLAVQLAPDYDQQLDKALAALAGQTVDAIKRHNVKYITGSIPRNVLAP